MRTTEVCELGFGTKRPSLGPNLVAHAAPGSALPEKLFLIETARRTPRAAPALGLSLAAPVGASTHTSRRL
jgi:hypothetical protein